MGHSDQLIAQEPELYLGIISVNIINNKATKKQQFWYISLVENPVLSGSIRMEGM